jgi:hypothetical protein
MARHTNADVLDSAHEMDVLVLRDPRKKHLVDDAAKTAIVLEATL